MPPTSGSSLLSPLQNNGKYFFPYSGFIFCGIVISISSFLVLIVATLIMFGDFSSNYTFNKTFLDSCPMQNTMQMYELFQLRHQIINDQFVLKELNSVELGQVSYRLSSAIEEEINSKTKDLNSLMTKCDVEQLHRKSCIDENIKNIMETQSSNVFLAFAFYVPLSIILIIAIFALFWKAKRQNNFTEDQQKAFKILAIVFGCHVVNHFILLYRLVYDNIQNFKPKEMPSYCTYDYPSLSEECYNDGTNCFDMFDLPLYNNWMFTIGNYLFFQILPVALCIVLTKFGKARNIQDEYESV